VRLRLARTCKVPQLYHVNVIALSGECTFLAAIVGRLGCTRKIFQVYFVNLAAHFDGRFYILSPSYNSSALSTASDSGSAGRGAISPAAATIARPPSSFGEPGTGEPTPNVEQNMAFAQF
jgi:hypothetical protein